MTIKISNEKLVAFLTENLKYALFLHKLNETYTKCVKLWVNVRYVAKYFIYYKLHCNRVIPVIENYLIFDNLYLQLLYRLV